MVLEEQKQFSLVSSELRSHSVNLQASMKGEMLVAVGAEQSDVKPSDAVENEAKEQSQQVISPDGTVISPEEVKAGEGEKSAEEKKPIEEIKSEEKQDESASENQHSEGGTDINILAATSEGLPIDIREGHSENLMYVWYGLPPYVDSIPRDFGIGPFPPSVQKIYLPPIEPGIAVEVSSDGPCCVFDVPIYFYGLEVENGIAANAITGPDGHTYSFTFLGYCDDEMNSQLIFTDTFNGSTSTYTITILSDSECEIEANCDNPIEWIFASGNSSSIGIDLFLDTGYAYDQNGNYYDFFSDGGLFLRPECCECSAAPIVLDLNNDGFNLTNSKESDIPLTIDGNTVQSAWVGPTDGFLTYDYSGEGPIENKNFILTENVPGAKTDLQALETLAGQSSGILDNSNAIWSKLGVWQDSNQNGKMDDGEYHTLSELGIKSIDLNESPVNQILNGNTIHSIINFNYADGSVGKGADVALRYEDVIQSNNNVPELGSQSDALSPSSVTMQETTAPVVQDAAVHSAVEAVVQQQVVQQV